MAIVVGVLALTGIVPGYALVSLAGFVPISILLFVLLSYNYKKIKILSKKLQISHAANNAKQVMEKIVNDAPDTYARDCRTKMQYLSNNGIDIEKALKQLNNNVKSYNELAAEFVQDCDVIEDELYTLMNADSLKEYANKARALKEKSHALGLTRLTDTSLFLELQACTGNLETIENNWKKLSFDLDDAFSTMDKYLKSLDDDDKLTFKMWGNRLQEGFSALETLDTEKAKTIFNEVIGYNVSPGITSTLRNIVTNIDEVMAE
jgi:HPt (histidine-containing phosphotransfer) domain-containing protein